MSIVRSTMRAAARSGVRQHQMTPRERLHTRAAELKAEREGHEVAAAGPFPAATVAVREPGTVARRQQTVDGAAVLGYARQLLTRYARFPSSAAADVAALWAAHTHFRDSDGVMVWSATPRLMLLSSEPGSGKSRVLELLGWLCPATFGLDTEPTAAGLAWTLHSEHATALLDEADLLFGSGKRHATIRAILNAGAYRNGTVLRMRGSKGERQRVYGPVALGGLDTVQTATGESLTALFSRSIVLRMRRSVDAVPALDSEACTAAARMRTGLGLWASQVRDTVAQARPDMPEWLVNRPADIWTPLLAIADAAGGDWPDRARQAAAELALFADVDRDSQDEDDDVMADLEGLTAGW